MSGDDDLLVTEQLAYYRAAAAQYDRPYAEREDLRALLSVTETLPITGDVLELACGTGQWTPLLAARARTVTAVDGAPEPLAIARTRTTAPNVTFVQADLFDWHPARRYDTVFFGFWLSHVPESRLPAFWSLVAAALAPGGKAIFIDDGPAGAADEHRLSDQTAERPLDDGTRHRIVKIFHTPETLTETLTALGWSAEIALAGDFLVGTAEPRPVILAIDDLRLLPQATRIARTSQEGLRLLEEHRDTAIGELWLDHDLGGDDTILPVVAALEEAAFHGRPSPSARSTSTAPTRSAPRPCSGP